MFFSRLCHLERCNVASFMNGNFIWNDKTAMHSGIIIMIVSFMKLKEDGFLYFSFRLVSV
jgi:hypothetical protein